jgi:Flp pilus assembly protein TadG
VRTRLAKRLFGDDRGSTTLEFALIFPGLVGILFGIIDGGRFISARAALSQAAAQGARTACLSTTTAQTMIDDAVATAAATLPGTAVSNLVCNAGVACAPYPLVAGTRVFLTIRYNFTGVFFRMFSRQMDQTSRMVCE